MAGVALSVSWSSAEVSDRAEVSDGDSGCADDRNCRSAQAVESMSAEWTDKRHSLYLNNVEASFINQLHSSDYGSSDFLDRLLKARKHAKSPCSNANLLSGQFKVLCQGCWGELKFERPRSRANIVKETRLLTVDTWVQCFRSPNNGKGQHLTSDQMDTNELSSQAAHVEIRRHVREVTISKRVHALCSDIYHQDSVGCGTEVSDQNFVGRDLKGGEQSNNESAKKRARTEVNNTSKR